MIFREYGKHITWRCKFLMDLFFSIEFWSALLSIVMIDLVLGGDNAILIALATRKLPKEQQKKAIFWGVLGAIVVRSSLTAVAVYLLEIPLLKFIGGVLLIWIAYKLLVQEKGHEEVKSGASTREAIKTIIFADLLMGIDNVLAVAGAADGSILLVVMGLLISIPIIVWGSTIILRFIDKYPIIVYLGAAVIAWTAGDMIVSDKIIHENFIIYYPSLELAIPIIITTSVLAVGVWIKRRNTTVQK